jgi:hypothetical protein
MCQRSSGTSHGSCLCRNVGFYSGWFLNFPPESLNHPIVACCHVCCVCDIVNLVVRLFTLPEMVEHYSSANAFCDAGVFDKATTILDAVNVFSEEGCPSNRWEETRSATIAELTRIVCATCHLEFEYPVPGRGEYAHGPLKVLNPGC